MTLPIIITPPSTAALLKLQFHQLTRACELQVFATWYRPPELFFGSTCYGSAIDVWAAGCILTGFASHLSHTACGCWRCAFVLVLFTLTMYLYMSWKADHRHTWGRGGEGHCVNKTWLVWYIVGCAHKHAYAPATLCDSEDRLRVGRESVAATAV